MEETKQSKLYPTGKGEMALWAAMLLVGLAMANFVLYGGLRLGFAITACASILLSWIYMARSGKPGSLYTRSVLVLCLLIAAAFGRSDDSVVKLVMVLFLIGGVNLALCQMAGQNRRAPGVFRSLLDAPRALFSFGVGKIAPAMSGVSSFFRTGGEASRRTGAILAGIAIALPVLAVLIPLLIFSDAAFEGLMDLLPDFEFEEAVATLFWGLPLFLVLYTRAVALRREESVPVPEKRGKGLHPFTVNTVLALICGVYLVYLFSQLAYFGGGFSGIVPEGYTTAQYARRGFFEMAWLCAINLAIMACSVSLASRQSPAGLTTRLLCLFLGLVTLFLVSASCAKMVLYIRSFGLTRARVLTMATILFLGAATVLVSVWLFLPKLQYMKAIVLIGLAIGACLIWADVDTQVAKYNVHAYQTGALETIDMDHLRRLGSGAMEYVAQLTDDADPAVAAEAKHILFTKWVYQAEDFRGYTYADQKAKEFLLSSSSLS